MPLGDEIPVSNWQIPISPGLGAMAQAVLRLADKYGAERLDAACAQLCAYGASDPRQLARVLAQGIASDATAGPAVVPPVTADFLHPAASFAAAVPEVTP
jgi:hypothetical protein